MQYWISDGTQQFGPYPVATLCDHGLQPHWLVWAEGMPDWARADTIDEIRTLLEARSSVSHSQTTAPPESGRPPGLPPSPPNRPTAQQVNDAGPTPQPAIPVSYHYQPQPSQTLAIVALVCGLAGFGIGFPASIVAIVFGHLALGRIRRGEETGHGMAVTGLVLGYIVTGLWALAIVGFCAIPCVAGL